MYSVTSLCLCCQLGLLTRFQVRWKLFDRYWSYLNFSLLHINLYHFKPNKPMISWPRMERRRWTMRCLVILWRNFLQSIYRITRLIWASTNRFTLYLYLYMVRTFWPSHSLRASSLNFINEIKTWFMRFKIINLILELLKIVLFQVLKQNKNYLIKKCYYL